MLTYSLSFNKDISVPPLKKILSAKIVEDLWDATPFIPDEWDWDKVLTKHRDQTIIASAAFTKENRLPSIFKTVFKEIVFAWCRAVSQVRRWKTNYDTEQKMGNLKAILLDARNYFTVDGEFDDLAWTKHVLCDPVYPITFRFYLACYYCLESEIAELWSELKNSPSLPFNVYSRFNHVFQPPLITLWIYRLENQLEALVAQNQRYAGDIYEVGFKEAAGRGYDYATRYFWNKMADPEKRMEDENFFSSLILSANVDEKVIVFLYSQLSQERKQYFLDWSNDIGYSLLWVTILLSLDTETERSEMIELVNKLTFCPHWYVLGAIASGLKEHTYPIHHEEVFMALWTHLSPENRGEVLEKCPYIIETLIEAKSVGIAYYVIKSLTLEQKKKYFSANAIVSGVSEITNRIAALASF